MDWLTLISAVGLVFVFEGLLPFLSPTRFRLLINHFLTRPDSEVRVFGFCMLVFGALLVYLARRFL